MCCVDVPVKAFGKSFHSQKRKVEKQKVTDREKETETEGNRKLRETNRDKASERQTHLSMFNETPNKPSRKLQTLSLQKYFTVLNRRYQKEIASFTPKQTAN